MVQRPAPLVQREVSNGPAPGPMVRRPAPWFREPAPIFHPAPPVRRPAPRVQEPAPIFHPGRHPSALFSPAQCLLHWVHFPSHWVHFFRRPIRQASPGSRPRLRSRGGEVPVTWGGHPAVHKGTWDKPPAACGENARRPAALPALQVPNDRSAPTPGRRPQPPPRGRTGGAKRYLEVSISAAPSRPASLFPSGQMPRVAGGVGEGRIRATWGWISVDRGSKATLPLTMPRRVFKSSAKDSARRPWGIDLQGGRPRLVRRGGHADGTGPSGQEPLLWVGRDGGRRRRLLAWILT